MGTCRTADSWISSQSLHALHQTVDENMKRFGVVSHVGCTIALHQVRPPITSRSARLTRELTLHANNVPTLDMIRYCNFSLTQLQWRSCFRRDGGANVRGLSCNRKSNRYLYIHIWYRLLYNTRIYSVLNLLPLSHVFNSRVRLWTAVSEKKP